MNPRPLVRQLWLAGWLASALACPAQPGLIDVRKIWDAAPHNAFTDLVRHREEWFCVLREGSGHVPGTDGTIRVLASADGLQWTSAALLAEAGLDLRDPKLSVTPDGRLMLLIGASVYVADPDPAKPSKLTGARSRVAFSRDGRHWSRPQPVAADGQWIWRVTWHEGTGWGLGYPIGKPARENALTLWRTRDGTNFEAVASGLTTPGFWPDEATIRFAPDGTMLALARGAQLDRHAWLGESRAPFTQWHWRDLGRAAQGPNFLVQPDERMIYAGRDFPAGAKTVVGRMTREGLEPWFLLPSGGDTSYPGMVWHEGRLWLSYYSSHEERTGVYLARIQPDAATSPWQRIAPLFSPPAAFRDDLGPYRSPLQFKDGRLASNTNTWAARRRELLDDWHQAMGAWPPLLEKPRLETLRSEPVESFTRHRVRVEIAASRFEEGWLLVPRGEGPFPAVLVPFYEPDTSVGLKGQHRDFARQLARRGFVALAIGSPGGDARRPEPGAADWQPLSFLAWVAANCHTVLAQRKEVDARRIGIAGHSYGGKWALFAACLHDKFAAVAVSDPGIVWDEARPNVNYWEPWYLGRDADRAAPRAPGVVTPDNPRTGAYRQLVAAGRDLHELHALLAPRPFFVSGGAEDPPERWRALNHLAAVNRLLGFGQRVGMSNRPAHDPTPESNEQLCDFFEHFLLWPPWTPPPPRRAAK
jgi:hypothetical protein